ncbi:minichromosome maintenance protein MCM [Candidatus Woesearchaeota archaeon]|nr:minichromosome maintenance protein MCM [Candidatus Woesearchaeota archaeon]
MDAQEQITKFQEFLEEHYHEDMVRAVAKGAESLVVNFSDLARFDIYLAEELLERPEDSLKAIEYAVSRFDLGDGVTLRLRFRELPESSQLLISEIRSKNIDKLYQFRGIVRQKTDVRPQVTSAKFECPSCGNVISILQVDTKFKEPTSCSCGRKGKFHMVSKDLVDAQKIVLEEASEDLDGGEQPKRMNIFLKQDLVSPLSDKKTNPGSKIVVVGMLKEIPIVLATGGKSTRFDLIIEANHVEPVQEEFSSLELNPEQREEILELSKDPKIYEKIVQSIAPTIYGHDRIKEALVLQLFGGCRKSQDDGVKRRGDIHILLVGDPGSGKSQLLKRLSIVAPKSRFVSGKGASGAGLTASVVRDEFLRGWALEAGALVLANKGLVCIDELDKMTKEDTSAMHEALEQQTVTISKANIQATLRSETTVLAAANPKLGRFDPYEILAKQIDLPSTLINRFDLIFPVKDLPDETKDEKLAHFILNLHKGERGEEEVQLIDTDTIKRYVAYAKQFVNPKLTDPALNEIKRYFVKMRNSGSQEGKVQSIPISARQLEGLVRLAEASARVRLSKTVTKKDAGVAIDLLHHCLQLIGTDKSGKFDIDRIATGISASQRNALVVVKQIIANLEQVLDKKEVPVEDVMREAEIQEIPQEKTAEIIDKLKRGGDLYSPKHGFISRI